MTPQPKRKFPFRTRKYPADQLLRVYHWIRRFYVKHGYYPSRAQVADKFHTRHPQVSFWYRHMAEARMIEIIPGVSRGLKLLPLQETTTPTQEAQIEPV